MLTRKTPMKPGTKPMKRTAMQPSKIGMHRTAMKAGTKRLRARKPGPRTESTFRSPALLALVRQLPCMDCGRQHKTQAAHSNQLRFGKGKGIKASDAAIMALCSNPAAGVPGCHELHDQGGKRSKLEQWAFEYVAIASTLLALIARHKLTGEPAVLLSVTELGNDPEAQAAALVGYIESGQLQIAQQP